MKFLSGSIFSGRDWLPSGRALFSPRYIFGAIFLITLIKYIDCWKFYLWYDELRTLGHSFRLNGLTADTHTPLYYSFVFILLKIFGPAFWVVKIPGIFCSLLLLVYSTIIVIKKEFKCFYLALFSVVNLAPTEWYLLRLGRMYGPLLVMSFVVAYMLLEYVEKNKINSRLFYPLLGLANFTHATFLFVSFGAVITIAGIKWIKKESGIGRHLLLSFLTTLPVLGYYLFRKGQLRMAMNSTAWNDGAPGLHWLKEMVYPFLGHQYPHTNSRGYPVDLIANLLFDLTLITIACFLLFSCLRLPKKFYWGLIGIFLLLQIKAVLAGPMELVYLWGPVLKMIVPIVWILYGNQRPNKKIIFSQASVFILFFVALTLLYPWKSFWHERYLVVILPFIIFAIAYMLEQPLQKGYVLVVIIASMLSYNIFVLKIFDQQRYQQTAIYQLNKSLAQYDGPVFLCSHGIDFHLLAELYVRNLDVIPCWSRRAKKRVTDAKYIVLVDLFDTVDEFNKKSWVRDFRQIAKREGPGWSIFAYQRLTTL